MSNLSRIVFGSESQAPTLIRVEDVATPVLPTRSRPVGSKTRRTRRRLHRQQHSQHPDQGVELQCILMGFLLCTLCTLIDILLCTFCTRNLKWSWTSSHSAKSRWLQPSCACYALALCSLLLGNFGFESRSCIPKDREFHFYMSLPRKEALRWKQTCFLAKVALHLCCRDGCAHPPSRNNSQLWEFTPTRSLRMPEILQSEMERVRKRDGTVCCNGE